jgi:MFS family permease
MVSERLRGLVGPPTSVAIAFFLLGGTAATWAARIPAVKESLHLSPGTLGLALLGPAVGSVLAMPAAGALLVTVAPRRIVQIGFVVVAGLLPVITLADSTWQLFAVLAAWGAGIGVIDVGVNTEAARVQERAGRRIMSRFHAAYSVGGLVGAGLGAAAAGTGLSDRANFELASVIVIIGGICSAQTFAGQPESVNRDIRTVRTRRPQWSWTLVALAAMAFGSFLAEGAANDWSAVYLHSSLGAPVGLAALTYTLFSATMACGRLVGDHLANRIGSVRLIRLSAGVAAGGFAGTLVVGRVWSGLVGFAILGAGLSIIVPLVFTSTSQLGQFTSTSQLGQTGPNLAFVTSFGYLGMLAGPGLIGGLAEVVGLPEALGVIVLFSVMASPAHGLRSSRPARHRSSKPAPDDYFGRRRQVTTRASPGGSVRLEVSTVSIFFGHDRGGLRRADSVG